MPVAITLLVALIAVFLVTTLKSFGINQEYQRGVLFRLGRLGKTKGPGWYWLIPYVDRVIRVVNSIIVAAEQELRRSIRSNAHAQCLRGRAFERDVLDGCIRERRDFGRESHPHPFQPRAVFTAGIDVRPADEQLAQRGRIHEVGAVFIGRSSCNGYKKTHGDEVVGIESSGYIDDPKSA